MTVPNPWSRHYQSVWHERAGDPRLPLWLRVSALAYGSHAANGHACYKPGEISLILGTPLRPADRANVGRAIRLAVEYGWLAEGSGSRCLVVPHHAVAGGLGNVHDACPIHSKPTRQRAARQRLKAV